MSLYHLKLNRKGLFDALEQCFASSSRDQPTAHREADLCEIAHAHLKRDLKEKAQAGDIKGIKDLIDPPQSQIWGSLKFPSSTP